MTYCLKPTGLTVGLAAFENDSFPQPNRYCHPFIRVKVAVIAPSLILLLNDLAN